MRAHSIRSISGTWYDVNFKFFIHKTILEETMWFKKMLLFLPCRLGSDLRVRDFLITVINNTNKEKIIILKKCFPYCIWWSGRRSLGVFCPYIIYNDVESNRLLWNLFNSLKMLWLNIQMFFSYLLNKAILKKLDYLYMVY